MRKYFLGNHRYMSYFGLGVLFLLFFAEIKYASPYAASWDQVDFALALDRYDLLAMQPHFPGYPYFILGGMLVHAFVENPAKALSIFNVFMLWSASIPMFLLAKKYGAKEVAWLITVLIQSASYVVLISSQPMSEGTALSVLWWYVWAVERAREHKTWRSHLLALFFFGLLLGIRLSYVPFVVALFFLWYEDWKEHRSLHRLFGFVLVATAFQLVWVMGVALTEGSISGFLKLALSFTNGHFQEWGGTVSSDDGSLWQRMIRFLFYNVIWVGIANRSVVLLVLYGWMFISSVRSINRFPRLFLAAACAYALWALFAQNIDKPRHIIPLVHFALFYVSFHYLARNESPYRRLFISGVVIVQLVVGIAHIREQALQLPATYQLAYDLQKKDESFVLYTWEEARVLDYLGVAFPYQEALNFSFFLQHRANYQHAKIYLTDHVVQGFRAQGVPLAGHLRKIKTYYSSTLADPVYGNITLYEWID
ncbi:nucleoporin-interacting protein [Anoxybacillus sp. J5B_2022]|uniref:nucleoporin-interacting protein n=1 Tax=Anoxybacillus sp. J5B_2022 TaxID=3003246 RepID=UPI002286AF99|nr:nucleoporin-interacting protein [Anoxybacillus sp. J5B_2022]